MIKRSLFVAVASVLPVGGGLGLTLTEGTVWTDFPIPVCFEEPQAEHKQDRIQIRKSVEQSWVKESAVSFQGWAACRENSAGIRILLSDGYPKTKARGQAVDSVINGMHLPMLWGLASLSVNAKTTVHEFGHALGFGHEYARPDAPFEDDCSLKDRDGNLYIENDRALTSFDFDSIMVGCVKSATQAFSIGVPKLSAADIYGLVSTYGSAADHILDADESGDLFGQTIAVGDFDGDDVPDLAVGAPGEVLEGSMSASGAVYLYRGDDIQGLRPWGRLTATDHPDAEGLDVVGFGSSLTANLLTSDQRMDLMVGAIEGPSLAFKGRTRKPPIFLDMDKTISKPISDKSRSKVVSLADNNHLDIAHAVNSVEPFDVEPGSKTIGFGKASALVDLDVDGHLDLIVTAPNALNGDVPSGQVFIYRSADTDFPWKQRPATFVPWYRFGQAY